MPGPLNLLVTAKSKNVVKNAIGFPIVLVKAAVRGAIDKIALRENTAAAFIKIDSPASVTSSRYIVPQVIDDLAAGLTAQRINASHVAENWSVAIGFNSDVVNVIVSNQVI